MHQQVLPSSWTNEDERSWPSDIGHAFHMFYTNTHQCNYRKWIIHGYWRLGFTAKPNMQRVHWPVCCHTLQRLTSTSISSDKLIIWTFTVGFTAFRPINACCLYASMQEHAHILHTCYTLLCACHCSHGCYSLSSPLPPSFPGSKAIKLGFTLTWKMWL